MAEGIKREIRTNKIYVTKKYQNIWEGRSQRAQTYQSVIV